MHPMVVNEFMIRFTWHQLPVAQPMQFPIWCALVTATVLIVAQFTWFCIEKPGQSLVFSRQADRRSTTSSSVHAG
jgi:peptidoglycan/LPS O-acetylase OafA/YrhL